MNKKRNANKGKFVDDPKMFLNALLCIFLAAAGIMGTNSSTLPSAPLPASTSEVTDTTSGNKTEPPKIKKAPGDKGFRRGSSFSVKRGR